MRDNMDLVLQEIGNRYQFNIENIIANEIGNSANLIYELHHEDYEYILRISKQPFENLLQYEAEMDFINYLFNNQVSVSQVIPSINNKFVEVIYDEVECYFVSVFKKVEGHLPTLDNKDEWNEALFHKWGKTMGKMHCLSKSYNPQNGIVSRKQWNEDIYFKGEYTITAEDAVIFDRWCEITSEFETLSLDNEYYGLIHYDFHQYNFFINNGDITVFDFDDCLFHWYVCDIAIALYHAVQAVSQNNDKVREEFAHRFILSFFKGYLEENNINSSWIKKIPMFLEYRRICSYTFISKLWGKEGLNEQQELYLKNMRYSIENRKPFVEIDFNNIKINNS